MQSNEIEIQSVMAESGEVRVGFVPTKEQVELLRTLTLAGNWKLYRTMLISAKNEMFNGILPLTESEKIIKQVGFVAGLNFAINQVAVIVSESDRKINERKKIALDKEKVKDFKRG